MTTPALGALAFDPHVPSNPARDEFMRRLDEHEAAVLDLVARQGPDRVETLRMTRRAVVAAYDQAGLVGICQGPNGSSGIGASEAGDVPNVSESAPMERIASTSNQAR